MLRKISLLLAFLFVFTSFPLSGAQAAEISAASAIVLDAATLEVLYQKNADEERPIASTTKILPSLIACESGKLDETVNITWDMVNTEGSLLGLRENDQITLRDLVAGMLLPSGNDAANAAAIYLSGSLEDFAAVMNRKAAELGLHRSLFVTPSGLDAGDHHSTARDMAVLTANALKNTDFSKIFKMPSADIRINGETHTIYNHNRLLQELEGCIGGKTGFTEKAGRCLISAAERNGNTLVCVTLGAPDDWNDHKKLYEECFAKYRQEFFSAGLDVAAVGGVKDKIKCSYSAEVSVLNKNLVTVELYVFPFVYCPVSAGDQIGKAVIKYKEKEIRTVKITADESAEYDYAEPK